MTLPTKRVTLSDMLGLGPPESKDWTLSCEKGSSLLFHYILRFFFDTALQTIGGASAPQPPIFDAPDLVAELQPSCSSSENNDLVELLQST